MINVFIAEDDFKVAQIIHKFTERISGFKVIGEGRDGQESLKSYQKKPYDLLIMDVYMPNMDGIVLLHEIKKKGLPIDVIMITAAKEMDLVKQCLFLGVCDYILKPFVFERFEFSLQRYLNRYYGYQQLECTQESLDKMLYGSQKYRTSPTTKLPKGLQKVTLKKILNHMESYPVAQSVEEISTATNLSKATVQRYMQHLSDTNKVEVELTYGTKGRPEHKYSYQ